MLIDQKSGGRIIDHERSGGQNNLPKEPGLEKYLIQQQQQQLLIKNYY